MSTTPPSPSPPSTPSSSFLANAKRRLSEHKPGSIRESVRSSLNLKGINISLDGLGLTTSGRSRMFNVSGSNGSSGSSSIIGVDGVSSGSSSIAPPDHRENTPLHALKDTIVLPHLHLPHAPSFSFPFQMPTITPSSLFCFNADSISDDEDEADILPLRTSVPKNSKGKEKGQGQESKEKVEKEVETDPLKRLRGNVVVLGGYRGSILRDAKSGKRLWIPLRVGFGFRKADLSLGLSDEDERASTSTVVPGKMLMALSGFIDLGKRLKDKLKSLEHDQALSDESNRIKFHSWGYDWRRRLDLSSSELIEYLTKLKIESRVDEGATVIAHSMGGLVALHALSTCSDPTIFKGIIFAGAPFQGCVNVLEPLRRGDGVLFNREICSPAVVFSMRSSFYFLPSSPTSPLPCFFTPSGQPLPLDFSSPKVWSDYNLSPVSSCVLEPDCIEKKLIREVKRKEAEQADEKIGGAGIVGGEGDMGGADKEKTKEEIKVGDGAAHKGLEYDAEIVDYLNRILGRVGDFYKTLSTSYDPALAHLYPPLVILTSQKTATVKGVISSSYETIKTGDYSQLLFAPGDGIVTYDSATELPGGDKSWKNCLKGVEESSHGHVSLLGDLDGVRRCLENLYPV